MSGAPSIKNPKRALPRLQTNRPSGAGVGAVSMDKVELAFSMLTGNRQTRRLATRNLAKAANQKK